MSNRYLQVTFRRCGLCTKVQKSAVGYRPIPNPILFNSDEHCRSFHDEQRRASGFAGMRVTGLCDSCKKVHSNWKILSSDEYLDSTCTVNASLYQNIVSS